MYVSMGESQQLTPENFKEKMGTTSDLDTGTMEFQEKGLGGSACALELWDPTKLGLDPAPHTQ